MDTLLMKPVKVVLYSISHCVSASMIVGTYYHRKTIMLLNKMLKYRNTMIV